MKLLVFGDFDPKGSGYQTIITGLGKELRRQEHDVVVYGLEYLGEDHPFDFPVVPTDLGRASNMLNRCIDTMKPDAFISIMDLTMQAKTIELQGKERPVYVGVFAVEGAPLLNPSPWASAISRMEVPLAISRWGANVVRETGILCNWLPVGIDTEFWHSTRDKESNKTREMLNIKDRFLVLTIADNQERKNWSCAFEAIAKLKEQGANPFYIAVTKKRPIGYDLWGLAKRFGIQRDVFVMDTGCTKEKLRDMYSAADAFLLTSKAEGLNLPVLEAMACECVPVVSNVCGLPDLVGDGRGLLIDREYEYIDPFGNQDRAYVSAESAAQQLYSLQKMNRDERRSKCREFTLGLTWDKAVTELVEAISEQKAQREKSISNNIITRPS